METLREQVLGHKEFGVVVDGLKQEGHAGVVGVAGAHQQQTVGFALGIGRGDASVEQIEDGLGVHIGVHIAVDDAGLGLLQDLRLCIRLSLCRGRGGERIPVRV